MILKEDFNKYLTLFTCLFLMACNEASFLPGTKPQVNQLSFTPFYQQLKKDGLNNLSSKDSVALGIYMMDIIRIGRPEDSMAQNQFQGFLDNEDMSEIGRQIDSTFKDLSSVEYSISEAWSYYQYYFKTEDTPKVYYINSGFNSGAYVDGSEILIGLDMYLGKENTLLKRLPPDRFAQYIKDKMDIAHFTGGHPNSGHCRESLP